MTPNYDTLLKAMKRIADPDDECHCGNAGPWQDVAQQALGFTITDGGDWYDAQGNKLTVDQMMNR